MAAACLHLGKQMTQILIRQITQLSQIQIIQITQNRSASQSVHKDLLRGSSVLSMADELGSHCPKGLWDIVSNLTVIKNTEDLPHSYCNLRGGPSLLLLVVVD